MGFFSRLFTGGGPSREDWGEISLRIAQGLDEVRKTWFQACVNTFREASIEGVEGPPITIKRTNLAGDAARASKAYQLYLVSGFLAEHEYIPASQGRDFADILFAQVCGTELKKCMSFFGRYHVAETEQGGKVFGFCYDITQYITGNNALVADSMLVTMTLPNFDVLSHMVVADAFGDQRTVAQLQAKLSAEE